MPPEPTIGGLTADQLVDDVTAKAFARVVANASLNGVPSNADARALLRSGILLGASDMYDKLVALGKDLLDPPAGDR